MTQAQPLLLQQAAIESSSAYTSVADLARQAQEHFDMCLLDQTRALLNQAAALLPPDDATRGMLAALRAQVDLEERLFEDATSACQQALLHARAAADTALEMRVMALEIGIDLAMGQYDAAWRALEQAFEWAAQRPDAFSIEFELWRSKSHCHLVLSEQRQALDAAERALAAAQRWGDDKATAAALGNRAGRWFALGFRLLSDGESDTGRHALSQCVQLSPAAMLAADNARCLRLNLSNLNNLAGAYTALEQDEQALDCFQRLYAMGDRTGLQAVGVFARLNHARLLFRRGEVEQSQELIEQALVLGQRHRTPAAVYALHLQASRQYEALGDWKSALQSYKLYHDAQQSLVDAQAQVRAQVMAVRLRMREAQSETLQLRQLAEELAQQALHDTLTGLPNRRAMEDLLQTLRADGRSGNAGAYLAIIDIDHFKIINDSFSHAMGDAVLTVVGGIFNNLLRKSDLLARWGGEEFVLLMRGCTDDVALNVCERLRLAVQHHAWPSMAPGLSVTISIGVAALDGQLEVSQWLQHADEQLYRGKRDGRNRVCATWCEEPVQGRLDPA